MSSLSCFLAELTRAFGRTHEFVAEPDSGVGRFQNVTACEEALRWSANADRARERLGETEADRAHLCALNAFPVTVEEALPARSWHSGKGILFVVTAHVADAHNERLTMLTLRSVRIFHPAADILVVDNASPTASANLTSTGGGTASYDSHRFFARLPAALPCGYHGCCDGKNGVHLDGCLAASSSSCPCCGRVSVTRTHEVGSISKATGSLREFGALAQAALHVHYMPPEEPHHIVLLQSSTGLKRPIDFSALDEPACPFTFLHVPYSWVICQSNSSADRRMRTARWGISCSEGPLGRRGFAHSFMTSSPNTLWTASSHGTVVMTRQVLARLVAMRCATLTKLRTSAVALTPRTRFLVTSSIFQLDVLDSMGNGRWCWETSAGLVGAWLAHDRRVGASANASRFSAAGGPLDARCIHPVAYKLHGNNIERIRDLNPKLQHHFKALGVHARDEAKKAGSETLPECVAAPADDHAPLRFALHPAQGIMTRSRARCAETRSTNANDVSPSTLRRLSAADERKPQTRLADERLVTCRSAQASPLANPRQRSFACSGGVWSCLKPNDISNGGSLAPSAPTASVAVQIRKAGSMQINALRGLFEKTIRRDKLARLPNHPRRDGGEGGGSAWTFVREPLTRLLSGYADIEGRLVEPHGVCLPFGSNWTPGSEPTHTMLPLAAVGNFSALDADRGNIWTGQKAIEARCKWELSAQREREQLFFRRHAFGSVERVRSFYTQLLSGELDHFQYVRRGSRTINHAYPQCHFLCGTKHLYVDHSNHMTRARSRFLSLTSVPLHTRVARQDGSSQLALRRSTRALR